MTQVTNFLSRYGPWALVAGASQGLGASYAHCLAKLGLNVILVARRKDLLDTLSQTLGKTYGIDTRVIVGDLANEDFLRQLDVMTSDLDVGLLIYNAAAPVIGPFLEKPIQAHLATLQVDCRAPLWLAHSFGQRFRKRGKGGLVLMSSLSGNQGTGLVATYAATKAFNTILAESLWYEWKQCGMDVIASVAGVIDTPAYAASQPAKLSLFVPKPLSSDLVAQQTITALGKKPLIIPGLAYRISAFILGRLLPKSLAVKIVSRSTYAMYDGKFLKMNTR